MHAVLGGGRLELHVEPLAERSADFQRVDGIKPDALAEKRVVIAAEIGGGVVPIERDARLKREQAGRLSCLLAARADTVIRVCCGLPELLKGDWP